MVGRKPNNEALTVKTESPDETLRLGRVLGGMLSAEAAVALTGDLGAGKTLLVKGIAKGLGVEDEGEVTSPSFVLVNEYSGRVPIFHIDLYRLQDSQEAEDLGWQEMIGGQGVTLIEWAEKVLHLLPEERIDIHIQWVAPQEREFIFVGKGKTGRDLVTSLGKIWEKLPAASCGASNSLKNFPPP